MTTTVSVATHDWPVEAQRVDPETGQALIAPERVPPNEVRVFVLHDRQGLVLRQLPKEPTPLSVPRHDPLPAAERELEMAA